VEPEPESPLPLALDDPKLKKRWKRMANEGNAYVPCDHPFQNCTIENSCSCQLRGIACEKYCNCSDSCENKWTGCICTSQCASNLCPCFVGARECDPDICKSCHSHLFRKDEVYCKNVPIQRGFFKRLFVAPSKISGWGCFIGDAAEKNDIVAEYCGEIISQEEAERRGGIYDFFKRSYMFNLNDEYVVDAARKGSDIRFANHSAYPNCYAKIMNVNGEHRIGIFAKQRIEAGEELHFDYKYKSPSHLSMVNIESRRPSTESNKDKRIIMKKSAI